jgi:hypothetical protein
MTKLRRLWQSFVSSHRRALEPELARLRDENSRLRAENRALLNSILGIAGMKPLPPDTAFTTTPATVGHSEPSTLSRAPDQPLPTPASPVGGPASRPPNDVSSAPRQRQSGTRNDSRTAVSLRAKPRERRSWHQITRLLEFQSLRQPDDAATHH